MAEMVDVLFAEMCSSSHKGSIFIQHVPIPETFPESKDSLFRKRLFSGIFDWANFAITIEVLAAISKLIFCL